VAIGTFSPKLSLENGITISNSSDYKISSELALRVSVEIHRIPIEKTKFELEYILLKNDRPSGILLMPHGGPHAVYDCSYTLLRAFFALSGFHVVLVNFRGSTGFGLDFLNSLPGHVGDYDISDCMLSLSHVISTYPNLVLPNKVVYFGGSHAGFIGGHLIAKDKRIKATVLYNPVTNIASMISASDIPDWCLAELCSEKLDAETTKKMYECSPVAHVAEAGIPTLFIIGTKDLRVPPSQGLSLYFALKEKGVPTKVLTYPENHRIEKVEHAADYTINVLLWFEKHTS